MDELTLPSITLRLAANILEKYEGRKVNDYFRQKINTELTIAADALITKLAFEQDGINLDVDDKRVIAYAKRKLTAKSLGLPDEMFSAKFFLDKMYIVSINSDIGEIGIAKDMVLTYVLSEAKI